VAHTPFGMFRVYERHCTTFCFTRLFRRIHRRPPSTSFILVLGCRCKKKNAPHKPTNEGTSNVRITIDHLVRCILFRILSCACSKGMKTEHMLCFDYSTKIRLIHGNGSRFPNTGILSIDQRTGLPSCVYAVVIRQKRRSSSRTPSCCDSFLFHLHDFSIFLGSPLRITLTGR